MLGHNNVSQPATSIQIDLSVSILTALNIQTLESIQKESLLSNLGQIIWLKELIKKKWYSFQNLTQIGPIG